MIITEKFGLRLLWSEILDESAEVVVEVSQPAMAGGHGWVVG